jgi:S1-C subfamily serine protease
MMSFRCAVSLGLAFAFAAKTSPCRGEDALAVLKKLDEGFSAVFARVAPAVVVIEAVKPAEEESEEDESKPFDFLQKDEAEEDGTKRERARKLPDSLTQSEGSGFVIRPDGYLVTNYHVVGGAEKIEVRSYDGKRALARFIAADEATDIAVLKVDRKDLHAAEWGDSDALRIGQLVCAIGAPFNQDYSFTCGWVSGKGRSGLLAPRSAKLLFEDYIQTDAFINPGNSGGPLFDVEGKVIGMNTLINGIGRGLAFAIPSNLLRDISDQLIDNGRVRRPWLGVRITSLHESKSMRDQFPGIEQGVIVNTIEANAPAFRSDLRPGDLITAVDGRELRSAQELVRFVQRRKIGDSLKLTVWRKGQNVVLPVTTGEQPAEIPHAPIPRPEVSQAPPRPYFGLKLEDHASSGARVAEIVANSPAAAAQLVVGDIITDIEGERVADVASALRALEIAQKKGGKKGVLLNFLRAGKKSWAVIERTSK